MCARKNMENICTNTFENLTCYCFKLLIIVKINFVLKFDSVELIQGIWTDLFRSYFVEVDFSKNMNKECTAYE